MVENKELSFIDLLAVVIKYRKLEIIPAVLFAVIYGFVLFVIPGIFPSRSNNEVEIICPIKVEQMSSSLSSYLDLDVSTLAEKNLKDLVNFSKVQRSYNIWTSPTDDDRSYNTEVKNIFESNAFSVFREAKGLFRVTAIVKEEDIDSFNSFINEYIQFCSGLVEYQVESLVDSAEKNIEQMISRYEEKENLSSDISSLLSLQLEFKNYRESHKTFLLMNGQPFESNISKGRVKKMYTGVVIVFAMSFIISLILHFISCVKENPEKRKKIVDAWKAGK